MRIFLLNKAEKVRQRRKDLYAQTSGRIGSVAGKHLAIELMKRRFRSRKWNKSTQSLIEILDAMCILLPAQLPF
jgi:hypothetical protein